MESGTIALALKFPSLREHNTRQGFFEREEFEAVVVRLPVYLQDVARFAYLTGWRKGEIASLTWADVDRSGRAIRLRPEASKSGHGRLLGLEGDLLDVIERCWAARTVGDRLVPWVFHRNGARIGHFPEAWVSACKRAGLPGKLFHDLRRTAVRNMIRAGVRERVAMTISGHRTRAVFDRYNIVSDADMREAVAKTTAYVAGLPTVPTVIPLPERTRGEHGQNTDKKLRTPEPSQAK
ncbi:MAG: site-specific integrase [Nitrospinae bacterium]|nr:site-specific integrase [Nitrospinota bacterium]